MKWFLSLFIGFVTAATGVVVTGHVPRLPFGKDGYFLSRYIARSLGIVSVSLLASGAFSLDVTRCFFRNGIALGYVLVLATAVVVEVIRERTAHNLFFIEVTIY